jgi:hypothetical protein
MKKYLLLLLFIPFVFSCSKEDSDEPDTLNLQIGDMYAGGIVFQTGNGEGGMIAMTVDSGAMSWGQAMQLESNGWFVPSISQLETLYFSIGQGADNIGNFADGTYWSSSDYTSGNDKWVLNFSSGNSNHYNQVLNFRVRLISYF